MPSNIIDLANSRFSKKQETPVISADEIELTAVETLDLVRSFSRIKDPVRRKIALKYIKDLSEQTLLDSF
jgi:hypothetical protein